MRHLPQGARPGVPAGCGLAAVCSASGAVRWHSRDTRGVEAGCGALAHTSLHAEKQQTSHSERCTARTRSCVESCRPRHQPWSRSRSVGCERCTSCSPITACQAPAQTCASLSGRSRGIWISLERPGRQLGVWVSDARGPARAARPGGETQRQRGTRPLAVHPGRAPVIVRQRSPDSGLASSGAPTAAPAPRRARRRFRRCAAALPRTARQQPGRGRARRPLCALAR